MATTDTGKTTEPARTRRDGELAPTEILDTGSLADSLDGARAVSIHNDPPAGTRIGAWRVIDRIGQGGMGAVYRVERADGAFEQQAALKLIQPGAWSEDFGRRLEAERQILANLNHPNIARLLDGGYADDGWPYMVMELIDGMPIDQYCRQQWPT